MIDVLIYLISGIIAGFIVAIVIFKLKKTEAQKLITGQKEIAEKIIKDAEEDARRLKKTTILEAREEWFSQQKEYEKEINNRKKELRQNEKQYNDRLKTLDKRLDSLDRKEDNLQKLEDKIKDKEALLENKTNEVNDLILEQSQKLEQIAGLNKEEAASIIKNEVFEDARNQIATETRQMIEDTKNEASKKVTDILSTAIQRLAVDYVSESTVSVVSLPGDEMKGRIIGREGRNIRAFEKAAGVDLIIDDTPEAVVLSCFDPVRREVARLSLEKLISDGRIHPGRIEEVIEKTRKEMDEHLVVIGKEACLETNIHTISPNLIKVIGRLHYRTSYGQNILLHSKEAAWICGIIAAELGLDEEIARRAGFLHDIGKALDHEYEGSHASIGANLARKNGESKIIVNAIEAHHEEVEAQSVYAVLVQAADAISGARPGARREMLETYMKRLEKLEEIANSIEGVNKSYAIQAGREIRIIVDPTVIDDSKTVFIASDIAKRVEAEMQYPGQIKVTVIRETRQMAVAK